MLLVTVLSFMLLLQLPLFQVPFCLCWIAVHSFNQPFTVIYGVEGSLVLLDYMLSGVREGEAFFFHHFSVVHLKLCVFGPFFDLLDSFTVEEHGDQVVYLEVYRVCLDLLALLMLLMELLKAGRGGSVRARSLHVLDSLRVLPLILLVVVGIFPKLPCQCLILMVIMLRVPELLVNPPQKHGVNLLCLCPSHVLIEPVTHSLHRLGRPDHHQLLKDVNHFFEVSFFQLFFAFWHILVKFLHVFSTAWRYLVIAVMPVEA